MESDTKFLRGDGVEAYTASWIEIHLQYSETMSQGVEAYTASWIEMFSKSFGVFVL